MDTHKGLPILAFADDAAWDAWLTANRAAPGLWMKIPKNASGIAGVGKAEAIETALCHGWIDGQLAPFDARFSLTRFTPRGTRSRWSEINRTTALRLIAKGRMRPAGLAAVEAAQRDGRFAAAYAPASKAAVPDDLKAVLDADPKAKAFFATLRGANRYAILYRIGEAKTAKTRAARIETFVAMAARGETIHPTRT